MWTWVIGGILLVLVVAWVFYRRFLHWPTITIGDIDGRRDYDISVIGRYPKPGFGMPAYEIIDRDGRKAIKCLKCQKTSWHPGDVENLYCANCRVFHRRAKTEEM